MPESSDYAAWRGRLTEGINQELYPVEYLDRLLIEGRAAFLATSDAAIIIEIKTFPSGVRAVAGIVAAGDKDEIRGRLIPAAEEIGRRAGCKYGLIESRPGWCRAMKEDGYELFQASIIKEL